MTGLPFLAISIGIHILVFLVLEKSSVLFYQKIPSPVEISIIDKNDQKKVMTHSQKKLQALRLKPQNAKFLAEEDQTVKEETKAPNLGFLNPQLLPPQAQQQTQNLEKSEADESSERLANLGQNLFLTTKQLASDTTSLDFIKDGVMTSLNTERSLYYSFFNRVDQQIVGSWYKNLHDYEMRLSPDDIKRLGGRDWTTILEIILDSEGHYQKHIVHQSSGDLPMDLAAIQAFVKAAYFPNPPKDMIKPDGTVRLYYGFIVKTPPPRRWARERS